MSDTGSVAVAALTVRVLLIGGILLALPRITRKGLLFGTYVGEEPADREAARRVRSDWYRGCVLLMVVALLVGWGIALAGAPMVGNLSGTVVLLLGAVALYVPIYSKARQLASPGAAEQANKAVAVIDSDAPKGATLARVALGICVAGALANYAYAWVGPAGSKRLFVAAILFASANLAISPFLAVHALLTAKAKRSIRGGTGGGSLEAQNAFRSVVSRMTSWWALAICAFATYFSVQLHHLGLGRGSGPMLGLTAVAVMLFAAIATIWIMKKYGQGGALLERGAAQAPLTNGLADNTHWVWGLFYVDRDDPSILVEKRFGFGYTFNYGNRAAVTIVVGFAMLCLALLAAGIVGTWLR